MKILFFIEGLRSGGKERRLLELIKYLSVKKQYNLLLVMMTDVVHYQEMTNLNIEVKIIKRKYISKDPRVFYLFYHLCKQYRPDAIHAWGNMPAFYAVPTSIFLNIPLINSQITDAIKPPLGFGYVTRKINFACSDIILANSKAGLICNKLDGYRTKVIHNGVFLSRFEGPYDCSLIKNVLGIQTRYSIVMVASFSHLKNHDLFLELAKYYSEKRKDLTFVAIGDGENFNYIKQRLKMENITNVILTGLIDNVEAAISVCDIGILLSPFGEGLSNAIIEYMALRKPVIASNKGGNPELIQDGHSGFLLENDNIENISVFVDKLLGDDVLRMKMGEYGRRIIEESFAIDKMMRDLEAVYSKYIK